MKSAPTIAFEFRPSRIVAAVTVAIAIVAVIAPWLSGLPWYARALVSIAVLAVAAFALRRHLAPPFGRIAFGADGWRLIDHAGVESMATRTTHVALGPLLSLSFVTGSRRWTALIAPDNLDRETARRLRALLARPQPRPSRDGEPVG